MSTPVIAARAILPPALQMDEAELLSVLGNSLYPGASLPSIKMVVTYCKATGLDPMQKPVHIVPMWDSKVGQMRDTIMPGVGLYRTQAARSGQLAGISDPEFGPNVEETIGGVEVTYPAWCRIVVKRQLASGLIAEFAAVERWKENYAVKGGKEKSIAPNAMWLKRTYGQLAKCTQAQALRIAFPEMVGAAPTADEMEGKAIDDGAVIDAGTGEIVRERKAPEKQPYSAEAFERQLPKFLKAIADGKPAADVIAWCETKGQLTEAQKAKLQPPKAEAVAAAAEPTEEQK